SENCPGEENQSQTAPAKTAGDTPCEEENKRAQDYVDPQQCQVIRLPRDRHVPPSEPLGESDYAQSRWTANGSASQRAHNPPGRRSCQNGDDGCEDKVEAVKDVKLLLGHFALPHSLPGIQK